MNASVAVVVAVLVVAVGLALLIGRLVTLRAGMLRAQADAQARVDTTGVELSDTGPTVVHFSAPWCGPCAAVRRVVDDVCTRLPAVAHVEIDVDEHPDVARRLSVLSLPTTLLFDGDGRLRYRTTGVPNAADLQSALEPLLAR